MTLVCNEKNGRKVYSILYALYYMTVHVPHLLHVMMIFGSVKCVLSGCLMPSTFVYVAKSESLDTYEAEVAKSNCS